jgi:hypothetical protein
MQAKWVLFVNGGVHLPVQSKRFCRINEQMHSSRLEVSISYALGYFRQTMGILGIRCTREQVTRKEKHNQICVDIEVYSPCS